MYFKAHTLLKLELSCFFSFCLDFKILLAVRKFSRTKGSVLCYNVRMKIKNVFKIEYILFCFSLVFFAFTIFLKISSQRKYDELNLLISDLFSIKFNGEGYKCIDELNKKILLLQNKLSPFTYYSGDIENQFDALQKNIKSAGSENTLFFAESLELEKLIRLNQKSINFGYDCLYISSFFLMLLSIAVVLYKSFSRKNELLRQQSLNEAKLKFSQDLHDGVARTLQQ